MKLVRRAILVFVLLVILYPAWLGYQIWQQSQVDEVHRAEAIVVLGAAQYDGRPSPVFKARLDHAVYLFNEDLSSRVILTGGKQEGDRFTEAEAGARYLSGQGISEDSMLKEVEGRTTLESLENVKKMADEAGIETVLLVSDPLHSERIKRMAHDLGFAESYASWASYTELHRSLDTKVKELLHEIASVAAYELLDR